MKLVPIIVRSYSGYRADEHPVSFLLDDREIHISDITDRWYQGESNPEFPVSDYFRVKSEDNTTYLLKHVIKSDKWFLIKT